MWRTERKGMKDSFQGRRAQLKTKRRNQKSALWLAILLALCAGTNAVAIEPLVLSSGWLMRDAAVVPQPGQIVSGPAMNTGGWYPATVPGTVLTTLVDNKVYPEPLYGENNRPERIPDSLSRTSYWYRNVVDIPRSYAGKHIWLNFEGINYSATVWVNGVQVGAMRGAFGRGIFDISAYVKSGGKAVIAVLVSPEPTPGVPHEHTLSAGMGRNGGVTATDGPTFMATIGWDWIPAIRDRDTGIWQKVFLSTTGPVVLRDPLVTTDLPLPRLDSADVVVQTTVENITGQPQHGVLKGSIGELAFEKAVDLAPHSAQLVTFDPKATPALHMSHPKLWWPNRYGPQNLYKLHLSFETGARLYDTKEVTFGIRKITYSVSDSDNLTISVNGVPIFIRGGNWGMDEAMKRIPRARLDAQIRMHKLANLNLIRNWVGQSTSEDFYELCDQYGLLVWDEFFQPNPNDGPIPADVDTYVKNVREKVLRFRNHPSIMLWCARNEGDPPPEIDAALRKVLAELDPSRLYQPSSTNGRGVRSHGPYYYRVPREFYETREAFKSEGGTVSIPTLESIHGMMPQKDWESIGDDWAEHDLAKGASRGNLYPDQLAARYGKIANLADFVRKSQLANYEAHRAMYEGRNAELFHPATGIIDWMTNPAQPSFIWQIYHYDLEPNSSFFAVEKANEPIHIQFDEIRGTVEVIDNLPEPIHGASARITIYNLDSTISYQRKFKVDALGLAITKLGSIDFPNSVSSLHFIKLELRDANGKLLSDNFYWQTLPERQDDMTALDKLPIETLDATVARADGDGSSRMTVTLCNPGQRIALMTHIQLRRRSGERVLPAFYSDNYVSLLPGETKTLTVEASLAELHGEDELVVVDGWNVHVAPASSAGVSIQTNVEAEAGHWPVTGLPFQTTGLR